MKNLKSNYPARKSLKKSLYVLLILSVFLLGIYACGTTEKVINNKDKYTISIDEIFEINLKSNQTTGYSWFWENSNSIIISLVENEYKQHSQNKIRPKVGIGGISTWKFIGTEVGVDTIKLSYQRSFSANSAVKSKYFVVEVR